MNKDIKKLIEKYGGEIITETKHAYEIEYKYPFNKVLFIILLFVAFPLAILQVLIFGVQRLRGKTIRKVIWKG